MRMPAGGPRADVVIAPGRRRRHIAYVSGGLLALINLNFPFNPPFPTIGKPCLGCLRCCASLHTWAWRMR